MNFNEILITTLNRQLADGLTVIKKRQVPAYAQLEIQGWIVWIIKSVI